MNIQNPLMLRGTKELALDHIAKDINHAITSVKIIILSAASSSAFAGSSSRVIIGAV
jgi:hypothetical protein